MRGVQASCPACGGPVLFKISSSLVTVCTYCSSVVARGDRQLEDYGKVAAIVETNSPLQLGLKGKHGGKSFELVGRVQYAHSAGGMWDEWYAAFSNGKWGWLAEAQGRFYLTFEKTVGQGSKLPALEKLSAGETFTFPGVGAFTVSEVGEAKASAAAGEIPYAFKPNAPHPFADLAGPDAQFGTFDYSGASPRLYLGREVSLDDLGIPRDTVRPDQEPKKIPALHLKCPECAGPLTLYAPDETERVCCPNCHALMDANRGNLRFLRTLKKGRFPPLIPVGATGTLFDEDYTIIGILRRSVTEGGEDYFWYEYLLYNPRVGFRWLVFNDGHWSFVRPVPPGDVQLDGDFARYDKRKYRVFQRGLATVRYVLGECYWRVEVGEQAFTTDYVAPPEMLSVEKSSGKASAGSGPSTSELNISVGTYLPRETIEAAFGVDDLPRAWSVAPNQPFPVDRRVWPWWAGFVTALVLLDLIFMSGLLTQKVDQFFFFVSLAMLSLIPGGALVYKLSFESSRWKDSPFNPYFTVTDGDDD